jgi:hypothetical protein
MTPSTVDPLPSAAFASSINAKATGLAARTWYAQFRELVLKAAVKNIDKGIGASHC